MNSEIVTPGLPSVSMLYDGGCPLCSREVAHYRRLDKAGNVRWADISANQDILSKYGISYPAAMKHLHVIENDKIVVGAPAFAIVWTQLPYYRHLARIARLPGVMRILDAGYRIFAKRRFARRMACTITRQATD